MEYGVLASKSSEMFSNLLTQLRDLLYSHPYQILLAVGILAIISYIVLWKK